MLLRVCRAQNIENFGREQRYADRNSSLKVLLYRSNAARAKRALFFRKCKFLTTKTSDDEDDDATTTLFNKISKGMSICWIISRVRDHIFVFLRGFVLPTSMLECRFWHFVGAVQGTQKFTGQ